MNDGALSERLMAAQDRQADLTLLSDAIAINSVTGNETPFALFLEHVMVRLGFSTGRAEFLPGRLNVWGERGGGAGPNLMFAGHTDTVHTRGWSEHWNGRPQADPFGATSMDGEIWGRGACDLKGGICAALAGIELLGRAGLRLAGRISLAFVGDEESGEPGTGVSAGVKDLSRRVAAGEISKPDFAIYVEPTRMEVYTAQIGFFIADMRVTGKSAYFGTPELGVDALRAAHAILGSIWDHGADLAERPGHDLLGNPSILATSIEGGGYIAVPGECRISLIRKLCPGENLDAAVQEFEAAVHAADLPEKEISIDIGYPAGRDHPLGGTPVEIPRDVPAAILLSECIGEVAENRGAIGGAPYWSEMPFFVNRIGCPAVYCAPGDIGVAHTFQERIGIDDYLAAVRAFALFAVRYCGLADE